MTTPQPPTTVRVSSDLLYREDDEGLTALTHAWCANCRGVRPVLGPILPHRYATTDQYHNSDITCSECAWIIATVFVVATTRHYASKLPAWSCETCGQTFDEKPGPPHPFCRSPSPSPRTEPNPCAFGCPTCLRHAEAVGGSEHHCSTWQANEQTGCICSPSPSPRTDSPDLTAHVAAVLLSEPPAACSHCQGKRQCDCIGCRDAMSPCRKCAQPHDWKRAANHDSARVGSGLPYDRCDGCGAERVASQESARRTFERVVIEEAEGPSVRSAMTKSESWSRAKE